LGELRNLYERNRRSDRDRVRVSEVAGALGVALERADAGADELGHRLVELAREAAGSLVPRGPDRLVELERAASMIRAASLE
jgi:hypothetical protein